MYRDQNKPLLVGKPDQTSSPKQAEEVKRQEERAARIAVCEFRVIAALISVVASVLGLFIAVLIPTSDYYVQSVLKVLKIMPAYFVLLTLASGWWFFHQIHKLEEVSKS